MTQFTYGWEAIKPDIKMTVEESDLLIESVKAWKIYDKYVDDVYDGEKLWDHEYFNQLLKAASEAEQKLLEYRRIKNERKSNDA
jgi:hypothetical protein